MKLVAEQIRKSLKERFETTNLIGNDCRIKMSAYHSLNAEQYKIDAKKIAEKEREWSGIDNPDTHAFLTERYGSNIDDDELLRHREQKEMEKPSQLEMAITILLHKKFGGKYIVV